MGHILASIVMASDSNLDIMKRGREKALAEFGNPDEIDTTLRSIARRARTSASICGGRSRVA